MRTPPARAGSMSHAVRTALDAVRAPASTAGSEASGAATLRNPGDIGVLIRRTRNLRPHAEFMPIRVRLAGLSPAQQHRAELRLNAAARDCGCTVGSAFVGAGVFLSVLYLLIAGASPFSAGTLDLVAAAAVLLTLAVVGKVAGLAMARRRLVRELVALADSPGSV